MHIQLRSAEGGTYQLADMYRRGPNPLADMDRGIHIRGESKPLWHRPQMIINLVNHRTSNHDGQGSMSTHASYSTSSTFEFTIWVNS